MMCCHGGNPIFLDKKNKDWTSNMVANPYPPTSNNISFTLPPPSPPSPPLQNGHHMCITPTVKKGTF